MTEFEARELTQDVCWALLRAGRVGRLAAVLGSHVEVFPITYLVTGGTIVFRTGEGTKVAAMTFNPEVTFETDGYDATAGEAWSVIVRGRAGDIDDADVPVVVAAPLIPWQQGPKHRIVQIIPSRISGRRFTVPAEALLPAINTAPHAADE